VAAGSYDHALQKPYDFIHQFIAYQYLKKFRKNETKMIMANMNSKKKKNNWKNNFIVGRRENIKTLLEIFEIEGGGRGNVKRYKWRTTC